MAESQISIVNQALQDIGSRATISAMNENSNEARVASRTYDSTPQTTSSRGPLELREEDRSVGPVEGGAGDAGE